MARKISAINKRSYFEPILFLIYINNLAGELLSNAKLFADNNTSLFFVMYI